jgi:hypothetical protein
LGGGGQRGWGIVWASFTVLILSCVPPYHQLAVPPQQLLYFHEEIKEFSKTNTRRAILVGPNNKIIYNRELMSIRFLTGKKIIRKKNFVISTVCVKNEVLEFGDMYCSM